MAKALLDGADLKLGLFSANCSSGMAVTKIEDRWQATWDDNLRLGRLADEVGLDFMLPIARWIGYGGETNFHEGVLDPVALAAGLLAETERIFVFATIHTAFNHPLVAAKQMATVDQIGRGRAGLNIVAGWNKPEYDAMGVDLPQDHDDRYAYAQEWWEIVKRLWTEPGRYDHRRPVLAARQGSSRCPSRTTGCSRSSTPAPRRRVATSQPATRTSSSRSSVARTTVPRWSRRCEANARDTYGREVGVFTPSYCVCRETKAEAEEFHRWYADENADWDAVDNLMTLQGLHAQSFSAEMLAMFRRASPAATASAR